MLCIYQHPPNIWKQSQSFCWSTLVPKSNTYFFVLCFDLKSLKTSLAHQPHSFNGSLNVNGLGLMGLIRQSLGDGGSSVLKKKRSPFVVCVMLIVIEFLKVPLYTYSIRVVVLYVYHYLAFLPVLGREDLYSLLWKPQQSKFHIATSLELDKTDRINM